MYRTERRVIALLLVAVLSIQLSSAAEGIDVSQVTCNKLSLGDWQCMVNNGKSFAIVEAYDGGYHYGESVASCVGNAWAAGMAHVDIYGFFCPNCNGNNPCGSAVNSMLDSLSSQGVRYGGVWLDVEDCDGCWNDQASNVGFIKECVAAAQARGVTVGIYTSDYEWQTVTGMSTAFSDLQLWYAHYDGNNSFDDTWAHSFGGWSVGAMKQYYDSSSVCFSDADVDWYPN